MAAASAAAKSGSLVIAAAVAVLTVSARDLGFRLSAPALPPVDICDPAKWDEWWWPPTCSGEERETPAPPPPPPLGN